ncbi:proliferation marker protein Ki-67 isoform X1 [Osmerus eperlanus]|uniref:proliferation marker protein Ki-67 isoform X1 n=1 Tax=Osmerus eperlanus TaxID=29151 RepID=UPI002E110BF6
MPLHGKIVVIKRSGGDGTEFPLTAACLFGRKPDCDIRIQLPQVSKEHCKIDLNENKEVILTNLSSVNPTRVNGEVLQQSERLKHGDLITILDRSFRFEYPPAPTPKKRRSTTVNKSETLQVLQDQQVTSTFLSEANKKSDLSSDFCLKDGTNIVKLQQSDKSSVVEPKEDGRLDQNNTSSPFCELYEMGKQSLDSKTQRMTSENQPQTPASRFCTAKPVSPSKVEKFVIPTEDKNIVKTSQVEEGMESEMTVVPVSQPRIEGTSTSKVVQVRPMEEAMVTTPIQGTPKNKRNTSLPQTPITDGENTIPVCQKISFQVTPLESTACEVVESLTVQNTPTRRKSKQSDARAEELKLPTDSVISSDEQTKVPAESQPSTPKSGPSRSPRTSPRTAEKKLKAQDILQTVPISVKLSVKKRKSGELEAPLPVPEGKRKRVSFGTQLSPELFDKRLPPDSPLRKGATPSRRSLCVAKNKQSLLRRASVIGLIKEHPSPKAKASPGKKASPKRSVSSTKTPSPAKRSPKAKVISPAKAKTPSPSKDKSPKKKTKTPSPGSKSPSKEVSQTPKEQKTPKSSSPAQSRKTPTAKHRSSLAVAPSDPQTASEMTGTPAKTPMSSSKHQTPTVQGRFSVSRISTPSPVGEHDSVPQSSATATPRVRRKSMKSAKKTALRGVLEVMRHRRSGVSRASLKAVNSWADIVKFGQTKSQTLISTKKTATKRKTTKKAVVPKPKTPARKLKEHASTGHADSPMTIVVGRAHKIRAIEPAVGAPKLVHNIDLLPKNMKMDEDLTGVAEIFSTPACSKQKKSVSNAQSDIKTPLQIQSMSLIETSVMNTPEETGEMVVSPLSVVSTAKQGKFNSDAISRLLQDNEESSFSPEVAAQQDDGVSHSVDALEMSSEEQPQESKIEMSTPKQKPEQPDCFTGVKRLMTTPKQKMEPVEDLRGKLLKTPRAPKVSEVVFDGVKELLETPKPVPVLDEAPDPSPLVCATGIKRITKTPKEKGVPVEDMVGVKRIMKNPKVKGEMVEKNFGIGRLIKTPRQKGSGAVEDFEGLQDLMQETAQDETISPDLATEQPQEVCQDSTEDASESSGDMQTVSQTNGVEVEEKDLATLEPQVACEEHTEDASVLSDGVHIVSPTVAVELPQLQVTKGTDLATEQPHVVCEEHTEVSVPLDDTQIVYQRDAVETPQPEATDEKVEATNISTPLKKTQDPEPADKEEHEMPLKSESSKTTAPDVPVRGRGRKKTEEIVHTSVRQSGRSRVAQTANEGTEAPVEDLAVVEKPIPDLAPASKPKRGRKAKQDSVEEAETLQNTDAVINAITETEIATSQDPICDVALEKPRRGKKPKQSSAELPVAVLVPRARRGRMTKQESADKEVETVEVLQKESLETIETSVAVEKPRRGRKVKQDSVEQADIVDVLQKESLETIETSVPVEKPRRGRKSKQDSVEQAATVEKSVVDMPVTEEEEVKVPASKPKRGRKTKQDSVEQVESCSEAASAEAPVCQEQTIMAAEKPKRGGRRLKQNAVEQVNEPTVETARVEPVENEVQEQAAVILAKPKRGGRKTKQDVELEAAPAPTDKPDKTCVTPAEKPKRGRKTKQEVPTQEEKVDAQPVPSVETEALEEVDVPVTKPSRGRKVTAVVKEEIAPPSSAKKARRGATVIAVEAASEAAVPVTKSTTRGRGIKMSKDVSVITAEIQPEPVKRGRRGAKSADAVPDNATKASSAEEIPVDEKMSVPVVEVKKGKGRLSKKVKASGTVQADQTEVTQESDVENTRKPSKSVNWKAQLEMTREIQNVTPVPARASRGKRAKIDTEEPSAVESTPVKVGIKRKSKKAEESELSDPVPTGPVKRAKRGAKSTDATPLTDITGATVEVTNASTSEAPEGPPAKGKGRVSKKGKALSVDTEKNEEEQKSKPRRGRAGKL